MVYSFHTSRKKSMPSMTKPFSVPSIQIINVKVCCGITEQKISSHLKLWSSKRSHNKPCGHIFLLHILFPLCTPPTQQKTNAMLFVKPQQNKSPCGVCWTRTTLPYSRVPRNFDTGIKDIQAQAQSLTSVPRTW